MEVLLFQFILIFSTFNFISSKFQLWFNVIQSILIFYLQSSDKLTHWKKWRKFQTLATVSFIFYANNLFWYLSFFTLIDTALKLNLITHHRMTRTLGRFIDKIQVNFSRAFLIQMRCSPINWRRDSVFFKFYCEINGTSMQIHHFDAKHGD